MRMDARHWRMLDAMTECQPEEIADVIFQHYEPDAVAAIVERIGERKAEEQRRSDLIALTSQHKGGLE